jgi:hypothetical protein
VGEESLGIGGSDGVESRAGGRDKAGEGPFRGATQGLLILAKASSIGLKSGE